MKKLAIVIILTAALYGLTYIIPPLHGSTPGACKIEDKPLVQENYVKYCGEDGKNAFELLQATSPVEFQKYDFGVFVQSINNVKPDEKHFWKLYINGQEAQVGASELQTQNSDVVEWKIEQINN